MSFGDFFNEIGAPMANLLVFEERETEELFYRRLTGFSQIPDQTGKYQ